MQDVRLIGLNDSTSLAGFPRFNSGMMTPCLHIWGMSAFRKDRLQIESSSSRALGPSSFKKRQGNVIRTRCSFPFKLTYGFL